LNQSNRSKAFIAKSENRYAWHTELNNYAPDCYRLLSKKEWKVLQDWFVETDKKYGPGTGECGVPAISVLTSLINGNGIERIVQLGHYIGYSTLLIGAALKRAGHGKLVSIDIESSVTEFTQMYVNKFKINDFVELHTSDSRSVTLAEQIVREWNAGPQLLFIDSSHQEDATYEELKLWAPLIAPGGLIVLHDASAFSINFDSTHKGGVKKGLERFLEENKLENISINREFTGMNNQGRGDLTYIDACGLAIIHIPPSVPKVSL
jgi:predicted O-methyltransferase YrrM